MKTKLRLRGKQVTVEENTFDKVIRYFDPVRAEKRFKTRITSALASGYTGASKSKRSMSEWDVSSGDVDSDTLDDLPLLRQRSSDLVRNVPVATSAIATAVTNVVGTGLKLQSRIDRDHLGLTEKQADDWEANTEREFKLWADSTNCDAARSIDFYGQQTLAFTSVLERGDIFYLTPTIKRKGSPYSLTLQAIEADRVTNIDWNADSTNLAGGVQTDDYNAPVAYHFLKSHPGSMYDTSAEWTVIPAYGSKTGRRNVLHLFDVKRPGQRRGIPYLAPVMEALKQLGRYTDAELMAAVISGMFTVFIESEGSGLDVLSDQTQSNSDDLALGNGMIVDLAPGEKATSTNPGRPNTAFDPFVQAILRQVGAALEIPFELLVKHFTSSYSASKAAFVEAWKFFNTRRAWMVRSFCNPVYELWMDQAVSNGRIVAPGYFADPMIRKAYLGAMWIGPGKGSINEGAEVKAAAERVSQGFTTIAQESAELNGGDFDTNHRQRVKENKKRVADELIEPVVKPEPEVVVAAPVEPEPVKSEPEPKKDDKDKAVHKLSIIEVGEVKRKMSGDTSNAEFEKWLGTFYGSFTSEICVVMGVDYLIAKKYTDRCAMSVIHFNRIGNITGFVDWSHERYDRLLELRDMVPDNIVNVETPDVSVNVEPTTVRVPEQVTNVDVAAPEVNVEVAAPDVNVEVAAPSVNVEAAEPPEPVVVNVAAPEVNVEVTNEVKPTPVNVDVATPDVQVNVTNVAPDNKREVTFDRNDKGKITGARIVDE